MLEGHPALAESGPVPLLGLVNEKDPAAIEAEVDARIADGYRTLKVKVGWDVGKDLARVRHIQDTVAGRARVRIDANQGFDRDQRSEEHTSELQSLMRISYAVFCLKKKKRSNETIHQPNKQ